MTDDIQQRGDAREEYEADGVLELLTGIVIDVIAVMVHDVGHQTKLNGI